jgi:hypothetical protein
MLFARGSFAALGLMKAFLDVGAISWVVFLTIMAALWILELPEVPGTWGTLIHHYNPLAIPAAFFGFYILWHMLRTGKWGWLLASVVLAPFTCLVYYWRVVRIQLAPHDAQQIRICRGPPATYPVVEQARRVRGDLSIRK